MNLLRVFGIGANKILAKNCQTNALVTGSSRCWWFTINTKAVRRYSGDGAVYPNILTFSYRVDNIPYTGKRFLSPYCRVPQPGETICIYYDPENPKNFACAPFAPAGR